MTACARQRRWLPIAVLPWLWIPGTGLAQLSPTPSADTEVPASTAGPVRRAWTIDPGVTVVETFTDNVQPGSANKARDEITEVSPGVRITGRTARVKLDFDYALRGLFYARGSRSDQTQHALKANGRLEAVEKMLFLDVSGVVTRQDISAFGLPSAANYSIDANTAETSNFRLSPYLKGRIAGYADYELRYSHSLAHSKGSIVSDTEIDEWRARFGGNTALARLEWEFDAGRSDYDFNRGRTAENQMWKGMLAYRFNPQLQLALSAGREVNDYASLAREGWNTYGYGVEWLPSPRSRISATREKRFFGHGHRVVLSHRLPLSAIKYTDTRDVSALPTSLTGVGFGNIFDLLFTQLASSIPNEGIRTDYINNVLRSQGLAPDSPVVSGFLGSQLSVQRHQELSYVLRGVRNTLTLAAVRSRNERLGSTLEASGDFALTSSITQKGFTAAWSHQLTSLSSLRVNGGHVRSIGESGSGLGTSQKTLSVGITTRLGARTHAGVTARRVIGENQTTSYTENAVVGTLSVRF